PREARPLRILIAHDLLVGGPFLVVSAIRAWRAYHLAGKARRIGQDERLALAHELPFEILRFAVEDRAVVLRQIRAEKAIRAIRGGQLTHSAERRYVRPGLVLLLGIAKTPCERRGTVQVGGRRHEGDRLLRQVEG